MTTVDQHLDHFDHLRDMTGGPWLVGGWQAAEGGVRLVQFALEPVGVREPRRTGLSRLDQDLVVDVGDVGDDRDLIATPCQPAPEYVEDHFLADVSEMRGGLHGQSAVVDRNAAGHDRLEGAYRLRGGVVEPERG